MIDLTNITPDQANKIECALLILESDVKNQITGNYELAKDESLTEKTRKNLKANAQWWEEVYALIYGKDDMDDTQIK